MRWHLGVSILLVAVALAGASALAADDPVEKSLNTVCLNQDALWIGKDQKSVESNCQCKSKSETAMATPDFKKALLEQGIYDPLLIGEPDKYLGQVLKDCPELKPLMIEAACNDPTAPPDACAAFKDMVSKLK